MMAGRKQWVYKPKKPAKPKVSKQVKAAVQEKAEELVQSFLKPTFIKEPPEDNEWNYIVDIDTRWYGNYFYFCAKYRSPSPYALSGYFEERFARLEYVGENKFNLSYKRHTEQWWEVDQELTLEECLERIQIDPLFQP